MSGKNIVILVAILVVVAGGIWYFANQSQLIESGAEGAPAAAPVLYTACPSFDQSTIEVPTAVGGGNPPSVVPGRGGVNPPPPGGNPSPVPVVNACTQLTCPGSAQKCQIVNNLVSAGVPGQYKQLPAGTAVTGAGTQSLCACPIPPPPVAKLPAVCSYIVDHIIQCSLSYCGPCKVLAKGLVAANADLTVVEVDNDPRSARRYVPGSGKDSKGNPVSGGAPDATSGGYPSGGATLTGSDLSAAAAVCKTWCTKSDGKRASSPCTVVFYKETPAAPVCPVKGPVRVGGDGTTTPSAARLLGSTDPDAFGSTKGADGKEHSSSGTKAH